MIARSDNSLQVSYSRASSLTTPYICNGFQMTSKTLVELKVNTDITHCFFN